jgi:hypothetical protein
MQLNGLRRLVGQGSASTTAATNQRRAQQLSGLDLGVLDLKLGLQGGQRSMLTSSNVYDALNQSTRNIIKSIGES